MNKHYNTNEYLGPCCVSGRQQSITITDVTSVPNSVGQVL